MISRRHISTAATPLQYDSNSMNLAGVFCKMNIFLNAEIYETGFSNPNLRII